MALDGYDDFDFTGPVDTGTVTHPVYVRGAGHPVVIWQELPGIGPETLALADRLDAAGYRVYLPHLFGPLGRVSMLGNIARVMCMRREFHLLAQAKASPITRWMAALCAEVSVREGGAKVGTIGMCLTGNFALTLMAEPDVVAGVASQPALPILGPGHLHMSDDQIKAARAGMAAKGCAIAMRYDGDWMVPQAKFDAIEAAFGDGVVTHTFPGKAHSLLTLDPCEDAFATVLDYFAARFGGQAA